MRIIISLFATAFVVIMISPNFATSAPSSAASTSSFATDPIALHIVTMQWPKTLCKSKPCIRVTLPNTFTLHGVWPALANGTSKLNCTAEDFSMDAIKNIQGLRSIWRSFTLPENIFWRHEWEKHGSCSNLNVSDYFGRAARLGIKGSQDIAAAFNNAGIKPGANSTLQQYHDAVEKQINFEPQVRCFYNRSNQSRYLWEIGLCVDLNFVYQSCPAQELFQNCGPSLYVRNKTALLPNA